MQSAITLKATVQSGGKIEISDTHLCAGNIVDVIVLIPQNGDQLTSDVLAACPPYIAFQYDDGVSPSTRGVSDSFSRLSLESLASAYGDNEPEYSADLIKEANPEYEGR